MRETPSCLKQISGCDVSPSSPHQNEHFIMEAGKQPVVFENPTYAAKDNTSKVVPAAQVRCHMVYSQPSLLLNRVAECCAGPPCPPNGRRHKGLYLSFSVHGHEAAPEAAPVFSSANGQSLVAEASWPWRRGWGGVHCAQTEQGL